jgi:hypothetical protein
VPGHEIGDHHRRHGDGVRDIALSVPDAAHAYRTALARGARGVREPPSRPPATRSTRSSSATATAAPSCRATSRATRRPRPATAGCSPSTTSSATWSSAAWRRGSASTRTCSA